jgi:hypothetical protein
MQRDAHRSNLSGCAAIAAVIVSLSIPLAAAQAPVTVRIISPADGTTVEPGQILGVTVDAQPLDQVPGVAVLSPLTSDFKTTPPFVFSLQIPPDAPLGPQPLTAFVGLGKDKFVDSSITLQVETVTPVISLHALTPALFIATKRGISVSGEFADGLTRNVTRSRETIYTSGNPQVATVTAEGLVEGIDLGATTITVSYKDKSITVPVTVKFQKLTVPIDIKTGETPNTINLAAQGVIPVAILSTADFDATTVDALSVRFGPGKAIETHKEGHPEDVNADGRTDLVLHFNTQDTGIQCGQTSATLTGFTTLGQRISGSDAIRPIGPGCP